MSPRSIFTITMLVLIPGCEAPEPTLKLNNLSKRPAAWSNVVLPGDTTNGYFRSPEHDYRIYYDIGEKAGHYAEEDAYPNHQWIRRAKLHGSSFQYLLDEDGTLYVTFPDEGPANYWCAIEDETQVDYVLELLARYRHDLLQPD